MAPALGYAPCILITRDIPFSILQISNDLQAELIEKYQKAALPDTPWVTHTPDTKKGSYGFRNCLISFWYRERDLNSQDVAIGGF